MCINFTFQHGFGTVESCPAGENTLVLAAPGFHAGENEIFSVEYIIACCSRNKKLNIKDFRYSLFTVHLLLLLLLFRGDGRMEKIA
jgi:hypothetical protein